MLQTVKHFPAGFTACRTQMAFGLTNILKIILKLLKEKRTCLVTRAVFDTLTESCYSLFSEILEDMGMLTVDRFQYNRSPNKVLVSRSPMQIRFHNGSRIIFKGMDNPEKVKSINDVSIVWLEEASEIKYSAYEELLGRIRTPNMSMHFFISTNPVSRENWVYRHFFAYLDDYGNEHKIIDEMEFYRQGTIIHDDTYYHHEVKLVDMKTKGVFYDKLTLIYLEMPKFEKTEDQLETMFDKWMFVLQNLGALMERPAALQERVFTRLFEAAEIARFSRKELVAYEDSLKVYRDWYSTIKTAIVKGRKEGEEIGRERGRKEMQRNIARQMKTDGLSIESIAGYTHLSPEEIKNL